MRAWFVAHWCDGDLPGLRVLILLHDQVERGKYQRGGEGAGHRATPRTAIMR